MQYNVFAALMEFLYTDQVAALAAPNVDAGTNTVLSSRLNSLHTITRI